MLKFYTYPPCTTCKKAKKWLQEQGVAFEEIHLVEETPTKETLAVIYKLLDAPLKKLFNTSGIKYRQLDLKTKLPLMTEDEMLELLASDGMLIKRPLVTDGNLVTVGFKADNFAAVWQGKNNS